MKFNDFLKECREKDVLKNLSIYLVSSWLLLQVISVTWEPLGLPKVTLTYLLLVLLIGFPLYLYLLWRLRIKKLQITPGVDPKRPVKGKLATEKNGLEISEDGTVIEGYSYRNAFRQMYFTLLLIIGAIVIFSATLIIKANFISGPEDSNLSAILDADSSDKIAVLTFENNTTDPDLDVVGKMAVDWILHGITQNKMGQVISPKIVEDYANVLKSSILPSEGDNVLKEYLKPSKVITGSYFLTDGELIIQASILDENMNKTLISFESVSCSANAPLECIEALKQRILGYFAMQEDNLSSFEEMPPNFEAYQYLLEAQTKDDNTSDEYLAALNQAIAADSTFFMPKVQRLEYYYNIDEFAKVDSLYKVLSKVSSNNSRQTNLMNLYESLINGDYRSAYKYYLNEYKLEPFDIEINSTALVLALQFVNRPQDTEAIFSKLSMEDMDLDKCLYCEFRSFTHAQSLIELNKPQQAIELLQPYANKQGHPLAKEAMLKAYIALDNKQAVTQLFENMKLTGMTQNWRDLLLLSGKEYLRLGEEEAAKELLNDLLESLPYDAATRNKKQQTLYLEGLYYLGQYSQAEPLFDQYLEAYSGSSLIPLAAINAYKNGDTTKAERILNQLDGQRAEYQYGRVDYGMAQYYAAIEQEDMAMEHLLKAVAAGKRFTPDAFKNDVHFRSYTETEAFKQILTFWQ